MKHAIIGKEVINYEFKKKELLTILILRLWHKLNGIARTIKIKQVLSQTPVMGYSLVIGVWKNIVI